MLANRLETLLSHLEDAGDIVHSRKADNIAKTMVVLESLDAVFRIQLCPPKNEKGRKKKSPSPELL